MNGLFNLSRIEVVGAISLCARAGIDSKTRRETQGSRAPNILLRHRGVSRGCGSCPGISLGGGLSLWLVAYLGI